MSKVVRGAHQSPAKSLCREFTVNFLLTSGSGNGNTSMVHQSAHVHSCCSWASDQARMPQGLCSWLRIRECRRDKCLERPDLSAFGCFLLFSVLDGRKARKANELSK
jgi:hypothetical protein